MNDKDSKNDLDTGAVLVLLGEQQNRVGYYCEQNEQTYDLSKLENCGECRISKRHLKRIKTDFNTTELKDPIEIETGSYCDRHQKALSDHEFAVIYWDKPYGENYSLIHPSALVHIPSLVFKRYEIESKKNLEEALRFLLNALRK